MLQAVKYSRFFNYELVDLKVRINLELKEHYDMLTDTSLLHLFFFFFKIILFNYFNMVVMRTVARKVKPMKLLSLENKSIKRY